MSLLRKIPTILGAGGGSVPAWRQHLQPCEYLETDGVQYIDLQKIPSHEKETYVECNLIFSANNWQNNQCGCGDATDSTRFFFGTNGEISPKLLCSCGGGYSTNIHPNGTDVHNFILDAKNYNIKIDGNLHQFSATFVSANNTFTLGKRNHSGSEIFKGKIVDCKYIDIYNNINLIAAYVIDEYTDNKDNLCTAGVAGMVDTLTGVFYTNDGTGNFTHGNDINI